MSSTLESHSNFSSTVALVLIALLVGCSSPGPVAGTHGIREGMDKDAVLDAAGNPKRTFRTRGQDHWVYLSFSGAEEYSQDVTFEDGKVVSIGRPIPKQDWGKALESMQKSSGFEPADN